jgi:hypothetical protein
VSIGNVIEEPESIKKANLENSFSYVSINRSINNQKEIASGHFVNNEQHKVNEDPSI